MVVEKYRAERGRQQFPHRHDARAQPVALLADEVDALGAAPELVEMSFEFRVEVDAKIAREIEVAPFDLVHHRFPFPGERLGQQLLEAIGDARQRRMHDDRMKTWASRARTTAATFFQLLTLETLVPPNLRTTQCDSLWLLIERTPDWLPASGVGDP